MINFELTKRNIVYCVGLTGTIASGKSTVAGYFAEQHIKVINADQLARTLTASSEPAFQAIRQHFGDKIILPNGELDRRQLRHIIVEQPTERYWLEQFLHPLIRQAIQHAINSCCSAYCIIEIPLLTARRDYPYLNRILLVQASSEIQIARIMTRDHCDQTQAVAILAAQPTNDRYQALADDIIVNNGAKSALRDRVFVLHTQYLKNSQAEFENP